MKEVPTLSGILTILVATIVLFGGVFAYRNFLDFQKKNQQLNLCEQEYQKVVKTHLPYFNTADYVNRMLCYAAVAVKENDLSICDKVDAKNSSYTLDCYVRFAVVKNDLSVCEKLKKVFDSNGKNLQFDQRCSELVKTDVEYLDKNHIYINSVKWGDVQIITPKAGEILDKNKEYKITWTTDVFSDKNIVNKLIIEGDGAQRYITLEQIPAKQGYYYFTPSSITELKVGKKYSIYLNAGSTESPESKLVGTSDLFEFK